MIASMKIKGAIFDMDGTLLESLFFWEHFWRRIGKKYFHDEHFQPDIALEKQLRTTMYAETLALLAELYHFEKESFIEDNLQFLEEFYRDEVTVKPGAVELLSSLRAQGIPICVASASPVKYLEIALRAVGIRELIDSLHSCDEVGFGKEHPALFLKAADSMGVAVKDACVFEDSFLALETAKAAGFHTVGVYDKYSYEQERLCAASEIYLAKESSLGDLVGKIILDDRM